MGGFLHMMGYPDAAPTQAYGNQAYAMGNMFAAVGSMMAVLGAQTSGEGQHVDISIQECVTMALENAAQFYDLEKRVRTRFAGSQRQAGTGIFECADGSVYIFAGGMAAIRFWGNLVQWMKDEQVPSYETLDRPEWSDMAFLNSERAKDMFAEMFSVVAKGKTKEELYREAQRRRVPLCPVSTVADVAQNRQLAYRGFFTRVPHARAERELVMPGAPFQAVGDAEQGRASCASIGTAQPRSLWRDRRERAEARSAAAGGGGVMSKAAARRDSCRRLHLDRRGILHDEAARRFRRRSHQGRVLDAHGFAAFDGAFQGRRRRHQPQRLLCRPQHQQTQHPVEPEASGRTRRSRAR